MPIAFVEIVPMKELEKGDKDLFKKEGCYDAGDLTWKEVKPMEVTKKRKRVKFYTYAGRVYEVTTMAYIGKGGKAYLTERQYHNHCI